MDADDPTLFRAATAALKDLTRRQHDVLREVTLERGTAESIAATNYIDLERAKQWIAEASQRFAERFQRHLELGGHVLETFRPFLDRADDFAAAALRLSAETKPPAPVAPPAAPPAVTCPTCGAAFRDTSGQFTAFQKLASEGRIGLMIGCIACSLLFVPR